MEGAVEKLKAEIILIICSCKTLRAKVYENSNVTASIASRSFSSRIFRFGYGGILSKFTHVEADGKRVVSSINILAYF